MMEKFNLLLGYKHGYNKIKSNSKIEEIQVNGIKFVSIIEI